MASKTVNSIERGANILKSLADGINRVTELSRVLSLSKGTTHRLLKTLERSQLVTQDPILRHYHLGPLILELASKPIIFHQNLVISCFEEMKSLRDFSGETVVLHVRIGLERICLEELKSLGNIIYTSGKGFVAPIYTGSAGKILLSELKDDAIQLLLRNIRLVSIGPNTITDKKVLLKELVKVRKQGYATSFGERVPGSASISVPIKNYSCPVALSVLGSDNRFSLNRMMNVLKKMKKSASDISRRLERVHWEEVK